MKTFLHYFRHYRLATSLNLLGIAITLTGLYILCIHIDYNHSYNRCFPEYETLYRLELSNGNSLSTRFARPVAQQLEKCPQLESVTLINGYQQHYNFDKDGTIIGVPVLREPGNLLTVFGAKRVDGTLQTKMGESSVVLPVSWAISLFGDKYVAGRELKWENGATSTVAGVYEDFPANCSMMNTVYVNMGDENIDNHRNVNYSIFVKSKESPDRLQEIVAETLRQHLIDINGGADNLTQEDLEQLADIGVTLMPVSEMYFSGHDSLYDNGHPSSLYMQVVAAVLLLVICIINFTNFSMAQAPMRIRAVLTRRVLGESLLQLRSSLLAEAAFVGVLAYVLAMGFAWLTGKSPLASELFTVDISVGEHPVLLLLLLGVAIGIGLLSAAYSTRYITSFQPVTVMKGNVALSPQGKKARMWLVGLQICISLVMIIFIGTLYSQSRYIYKSEYGFAKDSILLDDIYGTHKYSCSKEALRTNLEQLPCVESVSFSMCYLGTADHYMSWTRGDGEKSYHFSVFPVDWKFLRTYGIDIVEGRDFKESDSDTYIINEAMKRAYPDLEVGKQLCDGDLTVVGVCKDFRAHTTRQDNSQIPCAFVIYGEKYKDWGDPCGYICIRMAPGVNILDSRRQIAEELDKYAEGEKSDLRFLNNMMENTYHEELSFISLMKFCSLLTLLITLIGVFCLTMFETEYRRKEIAIRKVMGSSVSQVLLLFVGKYGTPLAATFVLAVPVGYYVSTQWLQNFAEHTPVHWWLFPAAFLIVSAIVLLTVVLQSWRVATMNPFLSIKAE